MLLLSLSLFACKQPQNNETNKNFEADLIELSPRDTLVAVDYVADIHAKSYVEIRARFGGVLEQILVDEGQLVLAGQPLFKLSSTEAEATLSSAKAAVSLAEAELRKTKLEAKRVDGLVKNKVVAATELLLAEAEVEITRAKLEDAKANLKKAETQLGFAIVKAPFTGRVNRFPLKMGATVDPGQLLTSLSDNSQILAYFSISEKDYLENRSNLTSGRSSLPKNARLLLADGRLFNQVGQIETAESEFDPNTGTMAMRARFANPEGLLKHRSTGVVRLQLSQKGIFLIPQKAVQEIQDRYFVFTVGENEIAQMKSFVPITRVGNYYIVREGFVKGERIVAEGIRAVKDGAKVTIKSVRKSTKSQ